MGKKSKNKKSGNKKSGNGSPRSVIASVEEDEDVYEPHPDVDIIVERAREHCPEADEFYSVTRELFNEELWEEIRSNWLEPGSSLPKETAWKLVKDVKLVSLKTMTVKDEYVVKDKDVECAEQVELLYTTPYQYLEKDLRYKSGPQNHHQYWSIRWLDMIPGYNQTIKGSMVCAPFFIDPPFDSDNEEFVGRSGWNLRDHSDNPVCIQCIRLGCGLEAKDISVKDVARCLIPTIGILGKYHPGNHNHILQRTMLRLERQVRTWNEGDTSDPNCWETSDNMHRRGGMLSHPAVQAELKRESRWIAESQMTGSWWPELTVPKSAVECALYRDEDGYQHKLARTTDGTEVDIRTNSKKGVAGSTRDFMSALCTKTHFYKLDPEEVQKGLNNLMIG